MIRESLRDFYSRTSRAQSIHEITALFMAALGEVSALPPGIPPETSPGDIPAPRNLEALRRAAMEYLQIIQEFYSPSTPPSPGNACRDLDDGWLNQELTIREREVLLYLSQGDSKARAARRLGITESCVKRHCERIFCKLGTKTTAASVAQAVHRGYITL